MGRALAGAVLGCLLVQLAAFSATAAEAPSAEVPLRRVVLYTSGVGFFEHDGQVQDDAQVELTFNVREMNDLLMSMVVEDLGGGTVSAASYGSQTPTAQTLKTFSIDLAENPTLGQLLNQVRGEQVEVEAPNKIVGTVLGVEKHKKQVGEQEFIESEVLDLLTDDGLRAVPLEGASRIQLLNQRLDAELRKALAVLATTHAAEKNAVTLNFLGKGTRQVRVGYLQEMPVWRTSYRLVLSEKKPPFLQGWALVENTTETDWKDVDLTLVSGQPISFKMDLYQALFVPRPEVQLPSYASLRPQMYGEALERKQAEFNRLREKRAELAARPAEEAAAMPFGAAAAPAAPPPAAAPWNLQQGVQAAARAGALGELFQYAIAAPVTMPRQTSAMLPIVNNEVQGEKLAIYDESVQAKHPLNGLRLVNSTGLFLMQGPVAVFDGGAYAGDALIDNVPPGSERLVSYAIDLDVEVAPQAKSEPERLVSVKLVKGTMLITQELTRERQYTIKNSGKAPQKVLVVYPIEPGWTLVEPKQPAETTRDKYRFAVEVKPGEPATLVVREQQSVGQQIALSNADIGAIEVYIGAKEVSDKVKAALAEVVQRKQTLQEAAQKHSQLQQQLQAIVQEQDRIRKNMAELDRTSDLYKRYVKMLNDQEDQIARLQTEIQDASAKQTALQNALDQYLMGLDLP